jgi:hypothetical protein
MHSWPIGRRRIDEFEVLCTLDNYKLTIVSEGAGLSIVPFANLNGDGSVIGTVDKELLYTERYHLVRRGYGVDLWNLAGIPAQETGNNVVAEPQVAAASQIAGTGQRDYGFWKDARIAAKTGFEDLTPARCGPKGQMPAGGKSGRDDLGEIQIVHRGHLAQAIDRVLHILECTWPTGAGFAGPAVLDVPGRDSFVRKCGTEVRLSFQPVLEPPPPAMDADHHGQWAAAPAGQS